ncbi:hypothetical protein ACOI1H_21295 [Loktanella sp. DJP18]|uniref:hypothetical protein n=1 Tax=Loktanella sp. DJP18 TaxID=3409788 RepID=UPI003BB7E89F
MIHLVLRTLIRFIDQHPPRSLGLADLDGSEAEFRYLIANGLIREQAIPDEIDGAVVVEIEGRTFLVSPDGSDASEQVDLQDLRSFCIDVGAFARLIRGDLQLAGPPIEPITDRLTYLGSRGEGARREAVHLMRGLGPVNAMKHGSIARGHDPAPRHTFVAPMNPRLPTAVMRQMSAVGVRVIGLPTLINEGRLYALPVWGGESKNARLIVDCDGHVASLDDVDLSLPRREFAVIVALAAEATAEAGFVHRDRLATAIHDAVGHGDRNDEQVTSVISSLRRAFAGRLTIKSVRNVGYRLECGCDDVSVF